MPLRRNGLCRPRGRADGRVLVVEQVWLPLQLHRNGVGGPRLRQADHRRRGLYGHRRARNGWAIRAISRTWAIGPSAKASTASSSTAMRCSPGRTAGRACRWAPGGSITSGRKPGGSSRSPGTSIWPAASSAPTGAVCGRHLLPRSGRLAANPERPTEFCLENAGRGGPALGAARP